VSDQILTFLKFCLVAILYLFLARVVWIVARELRGTPAAAPAVPPPAPGAKPRKGKAWRLVLVEPAAEAGATFPVDRLKIRRRRWRNNRIGTIWNRQALQKLIER